MNICWIFMPFNEDNYKKWVRWLQALLLSTKIHSTYKNVLWSRKQCENKYQETKMFITPISLHYGHMLHFVYNVINMYNVNCIILFNIHSISLQHIMLSHLSQKNNCLFSPWFNKIFILLRFGISNAGNLSQENYSELGQKFFKVNNLKRKSNNIPEVFNLNPTPGKVSQQDISCFNWSEKSPDC